MLEIYISHFMQLQGLIQPIQMEIEGEIVSNYWLKMALKNCMGFGTLFYMSIPDMKHW